MGENIKVRKIYFSYYGHYNIIYPSDILIEAILDVNDLRRLYHLKDFTNRNLNAYLYNNILIWMANDE